jgi:magnesium-transporting ATPase (P-type)
MSKKIQESKTMVTGITTAVTSLTAIILHFTGVAELDPAMLGATVSALVTAVVFTILRLKTSEPIENDLPKSGLTMMVMMCLCLFCFSGCVRTFQAKKSVKIDIIKDPCKVQVHSDGELVFKLTSKVKCGVSQ